MVLLATSMVMAGSGNLKVLQLCRFLHKRTFGEMNYGFHMAHHMALGLLFLGGGRSVHLIISITITVLGDASVLTDTAHDEGFK